MVQSTSQQPVGKLQTAYAATPRMDLGGAAPSGSFTLRDTFAMHAMRGLIDPAKQYQAVGLLAEVAYSIADAMLLERSKTMGYKKKKG